MTPLDRIITTLEGTCLGRTGRDLLSIYRDMDGAVAAFEAACAMACPDGCGRCCEGFDPPVTRAEAGLVALHLLGSSCDVPDGSAGYPCLFYLPHAPFHCGIYPVRPLVCRAFGFTAVGGKDGGPCFHFCSHMPGRPHCQLEGQSLQLYFRQPPPRVDDYGVQLSAISHEGMGGLPLLSTAVHEALDRVRALRAYAGAQGKP